MKVIILAAGQGTRLRPLTDTKPKCMVELQGKPLIQHQIETLRKNGVEDIHIATGYLESKIDFENTTKHFNPKYASTNMVYTLFCAEEAMQNDDLLIAYGDIIFNDNVLQSILKSEADISVVVDKNWRKYWSARMENPLEDAETLKINEEGTIKELGKKPTSYDEIEGQYIGLIKIKQSMLPKFKDYYRDLDKEKIYDGKDYENMFMTSFLQMIADNLSPLNPVFIENGWMEVDAPSDLEFYSFLK